MFWLVLCAVAIGTTLVLFLDRMKVPPRELSRYIERRSSGHNPLIVHIGSWTGRFLMRLDRGEQRPGPMPPTSIGAQSRADLPPAARADRGRSVLVSSPQETISAIAQARPGDVITLAPGTYVFNGIGYVPVNRAGTETARITLRADRPGSVRLEFDMSEGFNVASPYWTFENLHLRGVCSEHANCDHAFHIVGGATHFIARNNTISDFNAHFKINGENGEFPDFGIIEGNTLTNTMARQTDSPVAPIDMVAVNAWQVRRNLITDFVKAQGDRISTGAFAKGAGSGNRFEQNIVLCEHLLWGAPGQRVGLSLGDGGTGKQFCRDERCNTEQDRGVIQSNLIAFCSDDGIYINRAAASRIWHNTLIDTSGISVRFYESFADVEGNVVDGPIRTKDDGLIRATDNLDTNASWLYLGMHPMRSLFVDPPAMRFAWSGKARRRDVIAISGRDLCGGPRSTQPAYGAFEEFSACLDKRD